MAPPMTFKGFMDLQGRPPAGAARPAPPPPRPAMAPLAGIPLPTTGTPLTGGPPFGFPAPPPPMPADVLNILAQIDQVRQQQQGPPPPTNPGPDALLWNLVFGHDRGARLNDPPATARAPAPWPTPPPSPWPTPAAWPPPAPLPLSATIGIPLPTQGAKLPGGFGVPMPPATTAFDVLSILAQLNPPPPSPWPTPPAGSGRLPPGSPPTAPPAVLPPGVPLQTPGYSVPLLPAPFPRPGPPPPDRRDLRGTLWPDLRLPPDWLKLLAILELGHGRGKASALGRRATPTGTPPLLRRDPRRE